VLASVALRVKLARKMCLDFGARPRTAEKSLHKAIDGMTRDSRNRFAPVNKYLAHMEIQRVLRRNSAKQRETFALSWDLNLTCRKKWLEVEVEAKGQNRRF
jgi:hypothetical protein